LKARAELVASTQIPGRQVHTFYLELAGSAQRSIDLHLMLDEEFEAR
jgi:hypothetical protein